MLKRTVSLSTYNLPMLWFDPHLYEKGSFYSHTLPATEGDIQWHGGHTGQCKRTGCCYNELVVAFFSTGGGVKGKKSIPVDFIIYL